MKTLNISQASRRTGLKYHIFRDRMLNLKIDKSKLTDENIKIIKNYKARNYKFGSDIKLEDKIKIIEYYLTTKENNVMKIATDLNFQPHVVNAIINEWFKNNRCLIVKSKIN